MWAWPRTLWTVIAAAGAACSGGAGAGESTTTEGQHTPEFGDFLPGPPLGPPPAPDPLKPGLEYLRKLEEHIQPAWASFLEDARLRLPPDHALNNAQLLTELELGIDGDGRLTSLGVRSSSGLEEFDRVAQEIVREGEPYEAPPELWASDDKNVHVVWRFARDARQAGANGAELVRLDLPVEKVVPQLLESGDIAGAAQRVARASGGANREVLDGLLHEISIAVLRAGLKGDDAVVASEAARIAARAGMDELVVDLREVAFGSNHEKRPQALRALGVLQVADTADDMVALIGGANDASPEDAASATFALSELGQESRATEAIAAELDRDDAAQWRALAAMTEVSAPASVSKAQALLAGRAARATRIAAASALGPSAVRGAKAREALTRCLSDSDAAVRASCGDALAAAGRRGLRDGRTYSRLQARFSDPDERTLAAVVRAAGAISPDRLARGASRVATRSPVVAAALATALEQASGDKRTAVLLRLLDQKDARVRRAAARSLARSSEETARGKASLLLADGDAQVRAAAVASASSAEPLLPLLTDPSPLVQAAVLARLTALRGRPSTVGDAAQRIASARDTGARLPWVAAWLGAVE